MPNVRFGSLADLMSALPPKADMCGARGHVCFGPIADMPSCLLDHVVSPMCTPAMIRPISIRNAASIQVSSTASGAQGPNIKVIARPCDQLSCGVSCEENDQIINAYALNPGGLIAFVDERHVTFRPNKRPAILVLVCIGR
jgi:hypothetical protein